MKPGRGTCTGWSNHYLDNVETSPTDPDAPNPNYDPSKPALMFDAVTTNDTISKSLFTYNQHVLLQETGRGARRSRSPGRADTITLVAAMNGRATTKRPLIRARL
jgi:hypothetical protein